MPLYDYECVNKRCKKSSMVMQFIVPLVLFDEVVKCPSCGKPLKKTVTAPFFKIN